MAKRPLPQTSFETTGGLQNRKTKPQRANEPVLMFQRLHCLLDNIE